MIVSKTGRVFKNLESYGQARMAKKMRGLDVTTQMFHGSIEQARPLRVPHFPSNAKYKGLNP